MKTVSLLELYETDYRVERIRASHLFWREKKSYSCLGMPKTKNVLLYLDGCSGCYRDGKGNRFVAKPGDVVYCPYGSEYAVEFFDFEGPESGTVSVSFLLYAEDTPIVLSPEVSCLSHSGDKAAFFKLLSATRESAVCIGRIKAVLYDYLTRLSEERRKDHSDRYSMIARGIACLESEEELSVREIAALCNISEVYFRKLFKSYCGMSPLEYRLLTKIRKAKVYLQDDTLSVEEISEKLGFSDSSYFIRQFRKKTGLTPLLYRKNRAAQA